MDKAITVFKAIVFALYSLHPVEEAPNTGEIVNKIIIKAGGTPPEPWCASFVSWCYKTTCEMLGLKPKINIGRSTSALYKKAKENGLITLVPKSADVFVLKDLSHTGIVWLVPGPDGYFWSMEGNEGNTVSKTKRHKDEVYFIKIW